MNNSQTKQGAYIIGVSDCGEAVCAAGARISTQQGSALEIFERSLGNEKNEALICKVTKSGHASTVEHIFFNLAFENVSVAVEQFMIEFRLASFTVKSRRYVDFGDCGYYVPECLTDDVRDMYCRHMDYLFNEYNSFVESGIPKEDARFLLPYCFRSNFYCSLNGRELLLVLKRMLYGSASEIAEIKELGKQLLNQAQKIAPGVFSEFESRIPEKSDMAAPEIKKVNQIKANEPKPLTELLACTPDAPRVIAESWLIGSGEYEASVYETAADEENVRSIIKAAISSTRPRCLESASFTFRINNVSLSCITHFARHRMQSILVPPLNTSDRDSFIIPDTVAGDSVLLDRYNAAFKNTGAFYNKLKALGVKESELVYCLLSGNTLDIVLTMNARELLLFFKLRTCTRAQWEIREFADEMLSKLRGIYPSVFQYFGPSCCTDGKCPEGRLSCGKAEEMRKKFQI